MKGTYVNIVLLHVNTNFFHTIPNVGADDLIVVLQLGLGVGVVMESSHLANKGGFARCSNTLGIVNQKQREEVEEGRESCEAGGMRLEFSNN